METTKAPGLSQAQSRRVRGGVSWWLPRAPPPLLGLWLLSPPAPREPWARPRAQGRSSAVLARLGTEPCSKGAPRGQQKPRGALTGEEEPGGGTRWERPFSEKRAVGEWGPSGRL